jgi:hypothetical protein
MTRQEALVGSQWRGKWTTLPMRKEGNKNIMHSMLHNLSIAALAAAAATAFSVRTPTSSRPSRFQPNLSMANDGNTENPLNGGELTSALARLDQEWQLEQKVKGPASRWSKIVLPRDDVGEPVTEQAPTFETEQDFVYLLEPPSSKPSCVVCFLGGAGLGQFPQVSQVHISAHFLRFASSLAFVSSFRSLTMSFSYEFRTS